MSEAIHVGKRKGSVENLSYDSVWTAVERRDILEQRAALW